MCIFDFRRNRERNEGIFKRHQDGAGGYDASCICGLGGRGKGSAKAVLWNSFLWGTGYLGFWAEKWILCNLLTEENIIADAFSAIAERAGSIRRICAVVLRVWKEPSENRKRINGITSGCCCISVCLVCGGDESFLHTCGCNIQKSGHFDFFYIMFDGVSVLPAAA